jgi:phosphomannomutase
MKNETLYLFDLDGTLSPSRQSMEKNFARRFIPFIKEQSTYIVSVSDIAKVKEQLPAEVFFGVSGILLSMGNEFYVKGKEVFNRGFCGNDYSLAQRLIELKNSEIYEAKNPSECLKLFCRLTQNGTLSDQK